jgi:2-polyprenyl-6-hydroxyphenyl methylase/3-demethylubiquinone-9 3-methyltransferase
MLEHVPVPASIVTACQKLLKPAGLVFFSTINRNPKSYLFAVLGAEYVLNLLPRGTHEYAKFIKPSELASWGRTAGLQLEEQIGMGYNPLSKKYALQKNIDVNYLALYSKPAPAQHEAAGHKPASTKLESKAKTKTQTRKETRKRTRKRTRKETGKT